MFGRIWEMSLKTWQAYWGDGGHVYLFLLCLLILFFLKKNAGGRRVFGVYTLAVLAVFFCPLTAGVIAEYCIGSSVYWRMLWLLPTAPVIAYVCTRICTMWKDAGIQRALSALFLGVIVLAGTQVYVAGNYQMPDNREKIPYEVKALADLIREDAGAAEKKKVAAPEKAATYMRIYAPDIEMPYGRGSRGSGKSAAKQLHLLLNQEQQALPAQVTALARRAGCNYLAVWVDEAGVDEAYEENGYALVGVVEKYHLYKRVRN